MTSEGTPLLEPWLALFDTATLPFYWGRYEAAPGHTERDRLLLVAQQLADRGVRLKGHPLVWHTVKARWADAMPLAEAEQALRLRIRREVGDFKGLVDVWDVINEALIMPVFSNEPDGVPNAVSRMCADKGRVEMVRMAVDEARSVSRDATLVINDFDLGPRFEELLAQLLDAGVAIDVIGLQSHMHQGFRGEEYLLDVCDRFARFGLPLHWTETTLVSGHLMPSEVNDLNDYRVETWPSTAEGELRQADEIVRHYRTLVSHPAVQAVTYWGFDDASAWLGAPCGLIRADGSEKPAYHALRSLVRDEWWVAETEHITDRDGRIALTAFAGDFEFSVGDLNGIAHLPVGAVRAEARLGR
ncbi:endo-1,4-beta-xylanase [Kribbella sp. NPDC004875]|uniref:endo-1,4-beta-xylanase n=1 Tax=Kribbella sp. NPDC004875 TaxID=3364107 RepID=UPI00369B4781